MSIKYKVIISVSLILIISLGISAYLIMKSHKEQLLNSAMSEAELVTSTIESALIHEMDNHQATEKVAVIQKIIESISVNQEFTEVRIINPKNGIIMRSAKKEEIGTRVKDECVVSRLNIMKPDIFKKDCSKEYVISIIRPIQNNPRCFSCHSKENNVNGLLQVGISLAPTEARIQQSQRVLLIIMIFSLLVIGLLINILINRLFNKPINNLIMGMKSAESGDLSLRMESRRKDEIGKLTDGFNTMIGKLEEAQIDLKNQHREEIQRAERLAVVGKLAAGVAHEINNPLSGMQNCTRLLKKMNGGKQNIQYLELLQDGLNRIAEIVKSLLNFAQKQEPHFTPTDINSLVRMTVNLVRYEFNNRNIEINLELDDNLPLVNADNTQLKQVILNLMVNSKDAMRNGGKLSIRSGRDNGFIFLAVKDTGYGIPTEIKDKIFDPFFSTKPTGEGTGLGLSVSYGMIKKHGGLIEVQSKVNEGAEFIVKLPIGF